MGTILPLSYLPLCEIKSTRNTVDLQYMAIANISNRFVVNFENKTFSCTSMILLNEVVDSIAPNNKQLN